MTELRVALPDVGEGLHEAEIVRWLIEPGQPVTRDQPLVEIQTDKSVVDLPAPADGVVTTVHGAVGDVVAVGTVLVTLAPTSSDGPPGVSESESSRPAEAAATQAVAPRPERRSSASEPLPTGKVRASPATRRAARREGIDLGAVEGSGPAGRVTMDDLRRHDAARAATASSTAAEKPPGDGDASVSERGLSGPMDEAVPLQGVRRRIAQAMTETWRRVPHITDMREVPADGLVSARAALQRASGRDLTYLPLLAMIVATALRRHPWMNATFDDEAQTVTRHSSVNLGVATATSAGLVVPVVQDVGRRTLFDLADEVSRVVESARAGRLARGDGMGGTFTISNSGSFGGWLGTPIVRSPEVAVALFGRIQERVVAVNGTPTVRAVLPVSVSADHRVVDGDHLGRFIGEFASLAAEPVLLLGGSDRWS